MTPVVIYQGELAHRLVKRFYGRTNKNNATKQIAKHERRRTRLRKAVEAAKLAAKTNQLHPHHVMCDSDPLPVTSPDMHHHISESNNFPCNIFSFIHKFPHDPAVKVCPVAALMHYPNSHVSLGLYPKAQTSLINSAFEPGSIQ